MQRFVFALAIGAIAALSFSQTANADTLARRGIVGVSAVDNKGALVIGAISPKSPAEAAGLQRGDRIVSVDGAPVATAAEFVQKLRRPAGQSATIVVERAGQRLSKTITLAEYPKETDPLVTTLYGSVAIDGSLRRTLTTIPNGDGARHPAVFFIGGIGCYSIDVPDPQDGYRNLAHALSRRGFVTLRLEKSAVGDSQGPPCHDVDFTTESRSYATALQAFRTDSHVDPNRVYLFGHSIGTIIAPRLAQQQPPAGIIVVAAVGRSWFEYELINWRRQLVLDGTKPQDLDPQMQRKEWCMHRLLIDKQSVETVTAANPECKDEIPYPVTVTYPQQVADLNILGAWTQVNVPVLAVYGEADFITDRADHQLIVDTINTLHPAKASLALIKDMDHYLWVMPSQAASFKNVRQGRGGTYNAKLSTTVLAWLCSREHC